MDYWQVTIWSSEWYANGRGWS